MPEQSPAEPDEDDAEETDATADTLRAVLHSNVSEAVNFEKRKVITAAKTTVNFPKWLDKFYSGWCQTTVPVIDSDPATLLKQQYAAESKRQLLNAIETSMPATMAANVKDVTDTWDERAVTLTTDLMETVK
jgi:hypothetical protein